jgi:hypothetical protein
LFDGVRRTFDIARFAHDFRKHLHTTHPHQRRMNLCFFKEIFRSTLIDQLRIFECRQRHSTTGLFKHRHVDTADIAKLSGQCLLTFRNFRKCAKGLALFEM